jgi:phosphatidylserine decarboxylase
MTLWTLCVDDLRLFEAEKQRFDSLHDCFVRKLKPGARPVDDDAHVLCSPCDAIIGEFGKLEGIEAIQAKGFPYAISELLGSEERARRYRNGRFITLRLKSSMYHRFHAPCDAHVTEIDYISGDTWNVNPVALKVVNRLFCKNERAVIDLDIGDPQYAVAIVAVAAILVASIRIHGIDVPLNLAYKGPNRIDCDLALKKGDEIGYFEHGSTILLFTTGKFRFVDNLATGRTIRMGQALLQKT